LKEGHFYDSNLQQGARAVAQNAITTQTYFALTKLRLAA